MKAKLDVELPNELSVFKERIEGTIQPYIEIRAKPENDLRLWQSKFGGLPYLPKDFEYPKDATGRVMLLLAQMNFAEIQNLEDFPKTGILQFYIASDHKLYGANFDDMTKQEGFRIIYFPAVIEDESKLVTDFHFLPEPEFLPLQGSCSLKFTQRYAPISAVDYQFEDRIFGQNTSESVDEMPGSIAKYELYGAYERLFPSAGHKIGGYPYFTQSDPRLSEKYTNKKYVLLFQMDSDAEANILWGDAGVGNFFIQEDNLHRLDFSRVLYSWDCA